MSQIENKPAASIEPAPTADFLQRLLFSWCDHALERWAAGARSPEIVVNNRTLSVAEMERSVAYARRHGFLKG